MGEDGPAGNCKADGVGVVGDNPGLNPIGSGQIQARGLNADPCAYLLIIQRVGGIEELDARHALA